jgi:DNA-binding MarR family transcriptional regulator
MSPSNLSRLFRAFFICTEKLALIPLHLQNILIINIIDNEICIGMTWEEKAMTTDRLVEDVLTLYHLIRRTSHPVQRGEITPEQYWLLRLLRRSGPMSIGQLADALGITGSSVTTGCKRLERAGLVQRERQSDDERMVLVALTPQGQQKIEAWQQERRAFLARLLAPLSPQEQDTLAALLERVLGTLPPQEAAPPQKEENHASDH